MVLNEKPILPFKVGNLKLKLHRRVCNCYILMADLYRIVKKYLDLQVRMCHKIPVGGSDLKQCAAVNIPFSKIETSFTRTFNYSNIH